MKKHIPSYEDYLTESYSSMLRSSAAILMADPKIRAATMNLVDQLVGKGINYAFSQADKSLGIQNGISSVDKDEFDTDEFNTDEFDNERIASTEDSADFVSTYMAKSVVKDVKDNIPDKSLRDIMSDLKDYFKRKINKK